MEQSKFLSSDMTIDFAANYSKDLDIVAWNLRRNQERTIL